MINLSKNQAVSLEKKGAPLTSVAAGVNWGKIKKKGFFGGVKTEEVDLDVSALLLDADGRKMGLAYWRNLIVKLDGQRVVHHQGDDLVGDDEDDGADNERVDVFLDRMPKMVSSIYILLNSYKGQRFDEIPYIRLRIYGQDDEVFAEWNIANDAEFKGAVGMIVARIERSGDSWKIVPLGIPEKRSSKLDYIIDRAQSLKV